MASLREVIDLVSNDESDLQHEVIDLVSDDESDQQHAAYVFDELYGETTQYGGGVAIASSADAAEQGIRKRIREMFAYSESELIEKRWRHPELAAFPELYRFNLVMDEYFSKGLRTQLAQESNDTEPWLQQNREQPDRSMTRSFRLLLKSDFPNISKHYIKTTLQSHKHLFPTYMHLAEINPRQKARTQHIGQGQLRLTQHLRTVVGVEKELEAARQQARRYQHREDERRRQEMQQPSKKETCAICLEEHHWVRQIHCDGDLAHFLCILCANGWMRSMIGTQSSNFLCFIDTCKARYATNQLDLLDQELVKKMAKLELHNSIYKANIAGLEHCPECEYMAVLGDGDLEFRCGKCGTISCRSCKSDGHYPDTCEDHAQKRDPADKRHAIEEAMTMALMQTCNKCQLKYIKAFGCNEMRCSRCESLQCYICSETIDGYDHFDEGLYREITPATAKRCPLYDNAERRHEMLRGQAELVARQQILEDYPDTRPEDLDIVMSDEVEMDTVKRIRAAGGVGDDEGLREHIDEVERGPVDID